MAGRRWTKEEVEKLEKWNGTCTVATMARRLGRSPAAVSQKMGRLGLYGFETATELLTSYQILKAFGIQHRTLKYWADKKGLKIKRISGYVTIRQEDLYEFMKNNQDLWTAGKVADDSLFMNESWWLEKKRRDRGKKQRQWSTDEITHLVIRYRQGKPVRQIAKEIGRTESSIKQKKQQLMNRGIEI